MSKRLAGLCLLAGLLLPTFLSCKAKSEIPSLYPVKGYVHVNKAPVAGVEVILYPVNAENRDGTKWKIGFPRAVTEEDGTFIISSFGKNDGAPKGTYLVLARWMEGEGERISDRLRGRYFKPETAIRRFDVQEQDNELNLELSK